MVDERVTRGNKSRDLWLTAALAATLIIGALLIYWALLRADLAMRADLLQRTLLVAQSVDIESVLALSGSDADLGTPDYLRLKAQFAAIVQADEEYQFVYLMGRKDQNERITAKFVNKNQFSEAVSLPPLKEVNEKIREEAAYAND